ncbi:hypothetical protein BJ165DRAFT_1353146 [Panaeolus papilionaceus]|nr:hypothetical protein BJ165DRAFT_1353146 [Panaeolus papilionaceus]
MNLVDLLKLCLAYEITDEMVDQIKIGFQEWVHRYEVLYYENNPDRVSACPLTIHALLHIGDSIRENGPPWLDQPIVQHGRVIRLDGGDVVRASDMVKEAEDSRDASYVRYTLLVDKYAHQKRRKPMFVSEEFYGQLTRTFVIPIPHSKRLHVKTPTVIVLVFMQKLKIYLRTNGRVYYQHRGGKELVDINTVKCLVGRIPCAKGEWAIVDRSDIAGARVD